MTRSRIRNGIDRDALEALTGEQAEAAPLAVRTDWVGGAQSVATITRGPASGTRTFTIQVDDARARIGTGAGPAPAELAAVALSAAFAQAFVMQASRCDVAIDALSVHVQAPPPARSDPRTIPRWHIECTVESCASLPLLRSFAREAASSDHVLRLAMRKPCVTVGRSLGERGAR